MEGVHQSVKITDGMLRALVQRLSIQIDNLGTTEGSGDLAGLANQLQTSLTQVQRVHEQLEASLARSLENEKATKKAAEQHKELAASALVTDKLTQLAAIFSSHCPGERVDNRKGEGDEMLGRLDAKLDTIITKLDKPGDDREREPTLANNVHHASSAEDRSLDSSAAHKIEEQLTAIQATLLELKDQNTSNTADDTESDDSPPNSPRSDTRLAASASSNIVGPARKRRREDENETSDPSHPGPLTEEQHKNLGAFAKLRSAQGSLLDRLVPCPDGGLWKPDLIYERFRILLTAECARKYATRLRMFMDQQDVGTWCCVRRAAVDRINTANDAGKCRTCGFFCVQIKRTTTDGSPASKYYYARIMH